jgi:hypothetical protein
VAAETGFVHARIIDNNDIAGTKIRGDVTKQPMHYRTSHPIDNHETRKVALLKWSLGYQPLWQLIIEVPCIHALSGSFSLRR